MRKLLLVLARLATVVLTVAVMVLSLIPNPDDLTSASEFSTWLATLLLGDASQGDKISHFIAYAAISMAGVMGFARSVRSVILVFVFAILFGGLMELLQGMVDERQRDAYDFGANSLGALAGIVAGAIAVFLFRLWKPKI